MSTVLGRSSRRLIRVETFASYREFDLLKRDLEKVKGAQVRAEIFYPTKELAKLSKKTGQQFSAAPPYEVFLAVLGAVSSITRIAEILYKFLKRRRTRDERNLVERKPKWATLRFDSRELTVKGNWSKSEIERILRTFLRPLTASEGAKHIRLIDDQRRRQLRKELRELRLHMTEYERLVRIGEDLTVKKSSDWRKKKAGYERRYREIRNRISNIERILANGNSDFEVC